MNALTLFGVVAVSAMLVFYALEERAPTFVLCFAGACAASSVYGFLQGAWPFGVVESIWTFVAVRRWRARLGSRAKSGARPIACDMSALSALERVRYDALRRQFLEDVDAVVPMATAFRLRLRSAVSLPDVTEWMSLERRCCPFLTLTMALHDDGTTWIEIGGSAAIKAFVQEEFASFTGP